ncbi:MAG: FKBP-type peptidyl-prolyl cis-trans isomerase [Myxococcaceae bacterium]|nr:FKBP-type peptidyl-prolyl cis-trans isomerase [Myxococcaceae bacterium]
MGSRHHLRPVIDATLVALCAWVALGAGCKRAPRPRGAPLAPVVRADGLVTQVLSPGDGDEAKKGDKIQVHFEGTLLDGGVFDSSRARGAPFSFWVGEGQVVQGLDEGLLGMREGEVRRLTIPPALGYGQEPKPKIPPNSTLVFEVELLDVR